MQVKLLRWGYALRCALCLVFVATLAACGGSSGGSAAGTATTLSGTAATGLPIPNATVTIKCNSASGAIVSDTTTTDANGAYSKAVAGAQAPCLLQVTFLDASGTSVTLNGLALKEGTANITPLTDALLTTGLNVPDVDVFFAAVDPAKVQSLASLDVDALWSTLKTRLNALGVSTTGITNPFSGVLKADPGNLGQGHDGVLDALKNSGLDTTQLTKVFNGQNVAPVAKVSLPSPAYPSTALTFSAAGSSDLDGSITNYAWNFGDGSGAQQGASLTAPTHTYSATGTYTVSLTVTDNTGLTRQASASLSVTANPAPTINASTTAPTTLQSVLLYISNAASTIRSVIWSFGDSLANQVANVTSGVSATVSQIYSQFGSKTVTATYKDATGGNGNTVGTGTIGLTVSCPANTAQSGSICVPTYTIGLTVSGLTAGTVVLQNNGGETLAVTANGAATFGTGLASGLSYTVTVLTQPAGQTCIVTSGAGSVSAANVTGIAVVCAANWSGTKQLGVPTIGFQTLETYGNSVATDVDGNVYVAGRTYGGLDGNTRTGGYDMFVTKYNRSGVKQFTRQLGVATKLTVATQVATDANGNVYVAGWTTGGLDGNTLTGTYDVFVTKYDKDGNKLFTRQSGVAGQRTYIGAVAVNANGIYVAGYTTGALDGDILQGNIDAFLIFYGPNGNKVFTRQIGTAGQEVLGLAVALDSDGYIYLAGTTTGALPANPVSTQAGVQDFFVSKFDVTGSVQFTRQLGVPGAVTYGQSVAADGSGNVYVAGWTQGGLDGNAYRGGSNNAFVTKYNSNGDKQFTRLLGAAASPTEAAGVAIDSSGNVYLAGSTGGRLDGTGAAPIGLNYFVTKYNSSGVQQFIRQNGPADGDTVYGTSVATSVDGGVFVAGHTRSSLDGSTQTGVEDFFVVKYSTSGVKQ